MQSPSHWSRLIVCKRRLNCIACEAKKTIKELDMLVEKMLLLLTQHGLDVDSLPILQMNAFRKLLGLYRGRAALFWAVGPRWRRKCKAFRGIRGAASDRWRIGVSRTRANCPQLVEGAAGSPPSRSNALRPPRLPDARIRIPAAEGHAVGRHQGAVTFALSASSAIGLKRRSASKPNLRRGQPPSWP